MGGSSALVARTGRLGKGGQAAHGSLLVIPCYLPLNRIGIVNEYRQTIAPVDIKL